MIIDAIIQVRGGSKGIPRKNLIEFSGKPKFDPPFVAQVDEPKSISCAAIPIEVIGGEAGVGTSG